MTVRGRVRRPVLTVEVVGERVARRPFTPDLGRLRPTGRRSHCNRRGWVRRGGRALPPGYGPSVGEVGRHETSSPLSSGFYEIFIHVSFKLLFGL